MRLRHGQRFRRVPRPGALRAGPPAPGAGQIRPRRHRIPSTGAPGMTSRHAPDRQPQTAPRPVHLQRLLSVGRTGWDVAAPGKRPEQHPFQRGQQPAVDPHQDQEGSVHGRPFSRMGWPLPDPGAGEVLPESAGACSREEATVAAASSAAAFQSPASFSARCRSRITTAMGLPTMDGRAISTTSTDDTTRCCWIRKASRRSRRARLRTTAPPKRRLVTTPRRAARFSGLPSNRRQFRIRQPQARRCPAARIEANTRDPCNFRSRPSRSRGAFTASRENASNGGQALATLIAATADHRPPPLGRHAGAESQLAFAADLRRLILAFHGVIEISFARRSSCAQPPSGRHAPRERPPARRSRRRYQRRGGCQETPRLPARIPSARPDTARGGGSPQRSTRR